MSWLNFNDSLNSLKGQLTNFASVVLTEGITNTERPSSTIDNDDLLDVQETFTNVELQESKNDIQPEPPDSWSWDSTRDPLVPYTPSKDELILTLQKKIAVMENEKKELTVSLEQLDSDCQQTTDKLITLKDNIQVEYDTLKNDFEKFKEEYTLVLNENMAKSKEIEILKVGQGSADFNKLQEENNILNKQLMISLKEVQSKNELMDNFNKLQNQYDSQVECLIAEKLINEELQRLYNNLEDVNTSLAEKVKQYSKLESNELIEGYEEITLQTANLAIQQNSLLLEIEELRAANESLKNEIELMNNAYNNSIYQNNELKLELEETKKLYDFQKQSTEEFSAKNCEYSIAVDKLKQHNEKLENECKQHTIATDNMNCTIQELTKVCKNVCVNNENIESFNKILEISNPTLNPVCTDLQKPVDHLNTMVQKSEHQNLHEKYIHIISANIQRIIEQNCITNTVACSDEDPQVAQFAQKVDSLLKILLDFKGKSEFLEKEICEVTQQRNSIVAEKNLEIEKLLKNSEILSQEVINKSQSLKDAEDECAELMKNNDLLITELDSYRKSSSLQTISESNEDNLLLLESQLERANKRIEDLQFVITDLESSEKNILDLETSREQLEVTRRELNQNQNDYSKLLSCSTQLENDNQSLQLIIEKIKSDFENIEYKYSELTVNFEALKEDNEKLKNKHADLEIEYKNLDTFNEELQNKVSTLLEFEENIKQTLNVEIEKNMEKDVKIRNLIEELQNSKMLETSWTLQMDTLTEERQTISEAKKVLESKYETCINEFEKHKEHNNQIIGQNLSKMDALETQVKELTISKDDLIILVRQKHDENVQYHDEIQRLNLHLSTEVDKAIMLEKQLNELSVDTLEISPEEITQKNEEIEKLGDQNIFLKEKCEVLAQNLLQEQSNVQKALQERQGALDKELLSSRELERLREHLVEIEEAYTQELISAEHKNKEMILKVNEIEQREKDSNSIYTSVNIRANQQVETLHTQLQLVTSQRDELRTLISDLEDKENKQVAALTNLQLVLEQFQREKEKDVEYETERIRRQIGVEKQVQENLKTEITNLKIQLDGSKQGLQAATRLSDQLEKSKQQVVNLKEELLKLQEQLNTNESKCKELTSTADMKVDKTLVKNLVLGYIMSNSNDQRQILKVIATVLDFNQIESEKVNLNKPHHDGWLNNILHPQSINSGPDGQQSLSEAFVRFLENESKPKVVPNLLMATQQSKDNSSNGSGSPGTSPHTMCEVVLPTFEDFGSSRSSSSILKGVLKNNS